MNFYTLCARIWTCDFPQETFAMIRASMPSFLFYLRRSFMKRSKNPSLNITFCGSIQMNVLPNLLLCCRYNVIHLSFINETKIKKIFFIHQYQRYLQGFIDTQDSLFLFPLIQKKRLITCQKKVLQSSMYFLCCSSSINMTFGRRQDGEVRSLQVLEISGSPLKCGTWSIADWCDLAETR